MDKPLQRSLAIRETTPASAPLNTEEGRALLQDRLCKSGRWSTLIGAVFLVAGALNGLVLQLDGTWAAIAAQLGMTVLSAGAWAYAARGVRSFAQLSALDLFGTWAVCACFIAMAWGLPIWARPELISQLCVSNVLALRAFWIPSSALRTAVVGAVPALSTVVSTWFQYQGVRVHPSAPSATGYASIAVIFALAAVLLTTLTSRTIFGLRERVREASQLGQYTLLEKIGEGGMGMVYKARHATLRRPTAIKLLPPERAGEHNLVRFEREVQFTASLTHPNTVAIYDYGRSADGVFYYAMEYLDGLDLETLVRLDGAQPPARVVHILLQVCGALEEAHAASLIHRDVKPQNIILCRRGGVADVVKVVDFGLVKELVQEGSPAESMADGIVGTPLYMAPESILAPARIDARADLYALGAVAYFLLTGAPPFVGESIIEICGHHLHSTPEPMAARGRHPVSAALEALVQECLAKEPERRPPAAAELAERLRALGEPAWSARQANDWWRAHEALLSRRAASRGESSMLAQTLAIDLRARENAQRDHHEATAQGA